MKRDTSKKRIKPTENCFISPAVITIKKDKSVKIAIDSRNSNKYCMKRKAAMPNTEDLISKISANITKNGGKIWMSKIDLDYAYGQAKLSREALKHCVFSIIGGDIKGTLPIQKRLLRIIGYPTVFREHIDKVLELKTPVWIDVIREEDIEWGLRDVLSKLLEQEVIAGYRTSGVPNKRKKN